MHCRGEPSLAVTEQFRKYPIQNQSLQELKATKTQTSQTKCPLATLSSTSSKVLELCQYTHSQYLPKCHPFNGTTNATLEAQLKI